MHIVAMHDISDPAKFWSTVQDTPIPEGLTLHRVLPNMAGTKAVCHWEADALQPVQDLVEGTVGPYSINEYYEVNPTTAVGLDP